MVMMYYDAVREIKMEIPANMLERLKQMADAIPLETAYAWPLPTNLPPEIQIPAAITGSYAKNIYLKENLAPVLERDDDLHVHYWIIRDWGGIGTFKISDDNNERIKKFKEEVSTGKLTQASFGAISSLSKLSSFWEPTKYAIYDSRAVFSLNWILFRYSPDRRLFPQPSGRNTEILKYNLDTLFTLSKIDHRYRSDTTAYYEYCSLLQELSEQIYGSRKPYLAEMLLFLAALTAIIEDIKRSVTVTIAVQSGTSGETVSLERLQTAPHEN